MSLHEASPTSTAIVSADEEPTQILETEISTEINADVKIMTTGDSDQLSS